MTGEALLAMGKIVGVHGVKGNLKVYSYAEDPSIFQSEMCIYVATARHEEKPYVIRWVKPHQRVLLFSLVGIDNRDQAEALVNAEIFVRRSSLPELAAGEYYWFDIIGLDVFDKSDAYLGRIDSILPTGGNDVYIVKDNGREILVPALQSVIMEIDLERKIMRVDLPEGL